MRIFAAIERILLERWRKIKIALKINKWPLLSLQEQRLQLKKQYLESLFRKKWHNFLRPWYTTRQGQSSPIRLLLYYSVWVSASPTRPVSLSATGTHLRVTMCDDLLASQLYQYHLGLSLRLTIMCDSNATCENAEISTQSQIGLL